MGFPRKVLAPDEEIVADLHPHWWYFAKPVAALVLSIAAGAFTLSMESGPARTALTVTMLASILSTSVWLIFRYLTWVTTHFVVTSDRVIFRTGVISKRGIDVPLEHVDTVHYEQSIVERLVGSGDVVIETTGAGEPERFTAIRRPAAVQRQIHVQQIEGDRRRSVDGDDVGGPDLADQLERLEGMFLRGSLSQEEFRAQMDKLMRR